MGIAEFHWYCKSNLEWLLWRWDEWKCGTSLREELLSELTNIKKVKLAKFLFFRLWRHIFDIRECLQKDA